ncbi:MAG: DUF2520 domain-containing protein [Gemmatimonadaceae bacterium]|nr:DUF2520 domain-containing protein [Gemmatimonadaceae bacterium]
MTTHPASLPQPVTIVGAGRAGRGIAAAMHAAGVPATLVDRVAVVQGPDGTRDQAIARAALLVVAVRDAQLDECLRALAASRAHGPRTIMLQVSGSAEPDERAQVTAAGHAYGTFHPLLPLADPAVAAARFHGAVVGVEGDAPAHDAACALAARLGAVTIEIPRASRATYHAAAVLASNFPVTLAALAESLLQRIGVADGEAHRAVRVLIASVDNLTAADRALDALTGPLVRGDTATIAAHLHALAHVAPDVLATYRTLTDATAAMLSVRASGPDAAASVHIAD